MDTLSMSVAERRRLTVFSQVKEQAISVAQAGRLLGISERQARRLWKRYREKGDGGLVHGLRGRPGNAAHGELKQKTLAAYRVKYRGFSAAHAAEFLGKQKLAVPRNTFWRWLKAAGLLENSRRIKPHRQRRQRRSCCGGLVQMDGSTHAWFGPDLPMAVLFVMIDDASSAVLARFYGAEDTAAAFDLFGRYARSMGLPLALYVDRDSIYKVNDPQALQHARERGQKEPLTQFGRAMKQLGVGMIFAHSPQAKGRVERVNRTFQDRLVKELALLGITTIGQANAYLEKTFLSSLNELIQKTPASGINLHRSVPRHLALEDVLCPLQRRAVGQDWCVTYDQRILQIQKQHQPLALAGKKVEVLKRADGMLKLMHQGRPLVFVEQAGRPTRMPVEKPVSVPQVTQRPSPRHPWNQSYKTMGRHARRST
jgi:transposase